MELETQKLIREGAEAANLMEPGPARDLIAHLTQALEAVYADSVTGQLEHARWQERAEELEAIVNDGGNQAAKYWTRLTAAEREMHARELHHFEAEQAMRESLELIQPGIWGNVGSTRDVAQARAILTRALNDKEAEK